MFSAQPMIVTLSLALGAADCALVGTGCRMASAPRAMHAATIVFMRTSRREQKYCENRLVSHGVHDRHNDGTPDRQDDIAERVRHRVGERYYVALAGFAQRSQPGRAGLRPGEPAEEHQRAQL